MNSKETLKTIKLDGYAIQVKNHKEEQIAMLVMSALSGVPIYSGDFETSFFNDINKVYVNYRDNIVTVCGSFKGKVIEFKNIDKLFSLGSAIQTKLTKDYDAIITEDGIDVGCQHIDFEAFDKLAEAVKQVRKQ